MSLLIDGQALVKALNWEIESYKDEIHSAVKNGWYDKAAKLHNKIDGLRAAKQMIERGDYILPDSK